MKSTTRKPTKHLLLPTMTTTKMSNKSLSKLDLQKSISPQKNSSRSIAKLDVNNLINSINDVVSTAVDCSKQIAKNYHIKPDKECYNLSSMKALTKNDWNDEMPRSAVSHNNLPVILINNDNLTKYENVVDRQIARTNTLNSTNSKTGSDKSGSYLSSEDSDSDIIDHIIEEAKKYKSRNADLERKMSNKFDSFLKYKVHCAENKIKSYDFDVIEEIKCIKNGVRYLEI
jgi:hypothetical protein